jgi:hypothetical protein
VPGASIRQLDNPVIKTTFADFRQDLKGMYGAGVGVERDKIRIESKGHFYQKLTSLAVLEVNGPVKKTFASDFAYNKFRIGFENSTVDEVNGLQEFCCEHVYSAGITSPGIANKELNLVSPYIHGMYSIENIRYYLFGTDTTSTAKDNEVCVIEVEDTPTAGVYTPRIGTMPGGTITGDLLFPADVYNLGHSPKSCLLRNLSEIKSYLRDGDTIKFQTASRLAVLTHGIPTQLVTENSDLLITTNGASNGAQLYANILRLFLPFICEANGPLPFNLLELMETVVSGIYLKYGVITLRDGENDIEVFNLDCGITPGTDDAYLIRGLCSPDTDINNLIR